MRVERNQYDEQKMRLANVPVVVSLDEYDSNIDRILDELRSIDSVVSVYQVGSVSSPGISDIDLWVIFEEASTCTRDPREVLNSTGKYLFSHNLFGTTQSVFATAQKFGFFHNYRLLFGDEQQLTSMVDCPDSKTFQDVKQQEAIEYLVKAFQVATIEKSLGVVNTRNLLLYAKALYYDLDVLADSLSDESLRVVLDDIMALRAAWFRCSPDRNQIARLHDRYCSALNVTLNQFFEVRRFWHPNPGRMDLPGSISMVSSEILTTKISGMRLPGWLLSRNRRLVNLQRRMMRWEFGIPMSAAASSPLLLERFELISSAKAWNKKHLPHFIPLPFGLDIFG